ncbi:hypothetical protein T484DRAFT_2362269 [Baffinella frigidus]|nr:hypothetical protein T484DRAFT_2362269 [Cryptophyta sp. CCMP2293]
MDRADLTEHEEEIVELLPGSRHQSPDLSEPTPAAEAPPQRSDHLFEALPAAEARHDLIPAPSLPGAVEELRPESPPAPAPPAQPPAPPAQPAVRSDSIEARAAFLGKLGIQAAPHEPPPGRRSPVPPAPAPAPLEPVSVAAPSQVVSASSSMAGPSEITSAPGPPEGLAPMDDPGYSPTIRPNSGLGLLTSVPELISGPKIHNLKSNKKSDPTKEMIDTEHRMTSTISRHGRCTEWWTRRPTAPSWCSSTTGRHRSSTKTTSKPSSKPSRSGQSRSW